MRVLAFILALVALAGAAYGVYAGRSERARLEKKLDEKTAALDASVAGVAEMLRQTRQSAGGSGEVAMAEVPAEVLDRLDALERQVQVGNLPATGQSTKEMLAEGAQETIRRIVREEQAAMLRDQEQERTAKKAEMQEKFADMARKHEERQKKRLEEWVKKFSEDASLSIAQEEGILNAYEWAQNQINDALRKSHEEDGMVMFSPQDMEKFAEQRDEKIKEVLGARFDDFETYRAKNPLPDTGFMFGVGSDGEAQGDAIIIETAPVRGEKNTK
jgi:hypothetical protein